MFKNIELMIRNETHNAMYLLSGSPILKQKLWTHLMLLLYYNPFVSHDKKNRNKRWKLAIMISSSTCLLNAATIWITLCFSFIFFLARKSFCNHLTTLKFARWKVICILGNVKAQFFKIVLFLPCLFFWLRSVVLLLKWLYSSIKSYPSLIGQ